MRQHAGQFNLIFSKIISLRQNTNFVLFHASYFQVTFLILFVISSLAQGQTTLKPQVDVDGNSVRILVQSATPLAGVRLVWTDRVTPDNPLIEAFPRYVHSMESPAEGPLHVFVLKVEAAAGLNPGGSVLPLDRTIHARVSATVRETQGWRLATSDNFSFRVIRDKLGQFRIGLNFEDGPRIINVSSTEALLQWKLNQPAESVFFHGLDREKMTRRQGGKIGNTATVIVDKLKPQRVYYYRVRCENPDTGDVLESPLLSFRTAAKKGGDFTFAVMGGSYEDLNQINPNHAINGVNVDVLNRCASAALRSGAEFILFTGNAIAGHTDNTATAERQYATWRRAVRGVNQFIPIFSAMGQREATSPWRAPGGGLDAASTPEALFAAQVFNPVNSPTPLAGFPPYSENVYTIEHAGAQFIVLNSEYNTTRGILPDDESARTVDRTQRLWLRGQLEQHVKAPWLFVVSHGPAWPAASAYGLALDHLPGVRDQVWEMIDNFDVDAVFSGQEPNYSHTIIDKKLNPSWTSSIHQFNTGAAGAPPGGLPAQTPWHDGLQSLYFRPHFLLISIDGRTATIEARTPDGGVFDTITLKKKRR